MGDENAKYGQNKGESTRPCCDMSAQEPLVSLLNSAYRGNQICMTKEENALTVHEREEQLEEVAIHTGCTRLYASMYSSIPD